MPATTPVQSAENPAPAEPPPAPGALDRLASGDVEGLLEALLPEGGLLDWATAGATVLVAVGVALLVHRIVFGVLARLSRKTDAAMDERAVRRLRRPFGLVFALIGVQLVMPSLGAAEGAVGVVRHALAIGIIVAVAWILVRLVSLGEQAVLRRFDVTADDNLRARQVHTQIRVLRRTLVVVIVIIAAAGVLMTFPMARRIGATLLASAGIAGLAVGIAARPVLENLLAGLQLALTQPVRLDDVVVIDGEWGRIEEITTTYVVVRIWDERRLIVPFSRVISQPFQNWTRTSASIMGTVFLSTDYTVPVADVRAELDRILQDHPKWDKRVGLVQVTDATADTVQLRALVSAKNSSNAWDLRCDVRERLIAFLQREHPGCLPRTRAEIQRPPDPARDPWAGRDERDAAANDATPRDDHTRHGDGADMPEDPTA